MAPELPENVDFPPSGDCSDLAVLVVTYHPQFNELRCLLESLPAEAALCVVDNASRPDEQAQLKDLLSSRANAQLLLNAENRGLAAALNLAAEMARAWGASLLLLMDQDSVPLPGAVGCLRDAYLALLAQGVPVACVGPLLRDTTTGLPHGFHQMRHGLWRRIFPEGGEPRFITCHNLNGSGTLVATELFFALGKLDESLFIDHVDTEWAFRVLAAGRLLFGVSAAEFAHNMGERGLRFWLLGWRVWPARSPLRHYYLFRNAVLLMRRGYVPFVWKFWAIMKLLLTLLVVTTIDVRRGEQLRAMLRGLGEGSFAKTHGTTRKISKK